MLHIIHRKDNAMSSLVVEPRISAAAARPIITDRFRWLVAAVLVIGPLLQAVEFLLESPPDDNATRVASWAADPDRIGLAMASGLLAVPFLLGGIAVLVALTRGRSPRLAWAAGTLMTFAMVGLAAVHGLEMAAYGLTLAGDLTTAKAILEGNQLGLPGAVLMVMFLGGAALGTLTLAAALWRSPLVPRIAVVFTLAFAVLDFALGQGVVAHLVNLVGFAIIAAAVLAGYSRQPREASPEGSRWRW
jgi:hypothetical protein